MFFKKLKECLTGITALWLMAWTGAVHAEWGLNLTRGVTPISHEVHISSSQIKRDCTRKVSPQHNCRNCLDDNPDTDSCGHGHPGYQDTHQDGADRRC